jgi:NAD(P)-dependent dehydrogenase (short-subunit alcohol dehydrogenase family)
MGTLSGKVALITGAAGEHGIGRSIAKRYAQEGATLYLVDHPSAESQLKAAAAECLAEAPGSRCEYATYDLALEGSAESMIEAAVKAVGRIDVLVNNAGVRARCEFGSFTRKIFNEAVSVNLATPFFASQAVAPIMKRQGGGRIIHIASQMGTVAHERRAVYGMTKAALIYLTKAMAYELAPDGIVVNAISPGPVLTGYMKDEMDKNPQLREARNAYMRLARLGQPEEIAEVALFLAASSPELLLGQNLIVDGGYTIH